MKTYNGCNAGTPLADVVYVLAMSKVLHKFRIAREALSPQTLLPNTCSSLLFGGDNIPLHDVSYIDDTAVPVYALALVNVTVILRNVKPQALLQRQCHQLPSPVYYN